MKTSKTFLLLAAMLWLSSPQMSRADSLKDWIQDNAEDLEPFLKKDENLYKETLKRANEIADRSEDCKATKKLSKDLRVALVLYTRNAYHRVNGDLRNDIKSPLSLQISKALNKLPPISGTTYRYTRLENHLYRQGSEVIFQGFTSTSSDPSWMDSGKRFGDVLMIIQTTKARDTHCFSLQSNEKEWLLDKGSRFLVTKRTVSPSGVTLHLSEL